MPRRLPTNTREVQEARERFLSTHEPDSTAVRESILTSWRRSQALRVQVDAPHLPFVREPNLDSPLATAAAPVLRQLADGLADEAVSVILTSADGVVLTRIGASRGLSRHLDDVQLAPGYSYAEEFVGTNGIGTALETRAPTLVMGSEHYAEQLGRLACAGVPITHPISGTLIGALDLTGWVDDGGGSLLATLAKTATNQIEGRLLTQASKQETALLNAYMRACRRSPQHGVLAIGHDLVLMNRHLRQELDVRDQAALLEHAADSTATTAPRLVATLPSGQTVRLCSAEDFPQVSRATMALFHVHLIVEASPAFVSAAVQAHPLPGVVGSSVSWRRSCQQIARCVREGRWVVVSGEPGSGRCETLKAAAAQYSPSALTRVFTAADLRGPAGDRILAQELDRERFSVILRDLDTLGQARLAALADLFQGHEHAGWVGATISTASHDTTLDALILPFFGETVPVPALRHRIEDLHELVPHLLRRLGHGTDLALSPQTMRQLSKYSWPGNVAQLGQVLHEVIQRQRSGTIGVDQLPPVCRALSRRTLTQIEALERDAIVRSLAENRGNKKDAAAALGVSRATIYRKIKEFGIDL
ncbi:sigma-54-dependent Fis family transcriptional regulator [Saccharopolyspora pogona]|uniref:sigma-54-dependent Fis family transcriptional regulator n=1 Tax=Saccharopolyspora pogona TaxID=333966 RepID=UPI0016891B2D|nr:helix-turn-helix domain-containing protein [Saccharopolyspora pogona]